MKKILLAAVLLVALQAAAQLPFEKITGNGTYKRETRNISGFTSIASSGSLDVMIAYGNSNDLQIEGDENVLPYIETTVENGKLQIKTRKNVSLRIKKRITVYVSATKLTSIQLSGSGDIIGNGKFSNDGTTSIGISGSGSVKLDFDRFKALQVAIAGSGNVKLAGTAGKVSTRISGSGNADCSKVISDDATAQVSGSGNVKVFANNSIDARVSGSGNIYYSGGAKNVLSHAAGSGRVSRRD